MAEKLTARQQALKIKAEQQAKAKQPTAPAPAVTNVTNIDNARDSRHQRYFDQAFIRAESDILHGTIVVRTILVSRGPLPVISP